jgi:hypothetical protein
LNNRLLKRNQREKFGIYIKAAVLYTVALFTLNIATCKIKIANITDGENIDI